MRCPLNKFFWHLFFKKKRKKTFWTLLYFTIYYIFLNIFQIKPSRSCFFILIKVINSEQLLRAVILVLDAKRMSVACSRRAYASLLTLVRICGTWIWWEIIGVYPLLSTRSVSTIHPSAKKRVARHTWPLVYFSSTRACMLSVVQRTKVNRPVNPVNRKTGLDRLHWLALTDQIQKISKFGKTNSIKGLLKN